jgi:hypothetical protein
MSRHDESLRLIVIATGGLPVPHGKTFIGAGATAGSVAPDEHVVEASAGLRAGRRSAEALLAVQD